MSVRRTGWESLYDWFQWEVGCAVSAAERLERAMVAGGGLDEAMESVLNADGDGGADAWNSITNGCAVGGVVGGGAEREHSVPGDEAVDNEQGLVRGG